jgi:hypothetical protein
LSTTSATCPHPVEKLSAPPPSVVRKLTKELWP